MGFGPAQAGRVVMGGRAMEVARVRIIEARREALARIISEVPPRHGTNEQDAWHQALP
jgi:hypothetical protein